MAEDPTTAAGRKNQAEGLTDVMDRNRGYATPAKLFVMMAAAIFLGEVIVMFVLAAIPPIPKGTEAFVDGMMITALMTPVLYLFLYRPMAAEIDRRRAAELNLRVLNRDLEEQVQERIEKQLQTNERLNKELRQRIQARDQTWKDQQFIRSVVEAAPCLFMIYDVAARRCVFANSRVEDVLGYATEELVDPDRDFLRDLLSPEDYSTLTEVHIEAVNQGLSTNDLGEIPMRMRSGEWRQMAARYSVLRSDPQGLPEEIMLAAIER